MARSLEPRRRFLLATSQAVCEEGALRQVIVEASDGFALLRLKGLKEAFAVPRGAVYHLAAAQAAEREAHSRRARLRS